MRTTVRLPKRCCWLRPEEFPSPNSERMKKFGLVSAYFEADGEGAFHSAASGNFPSPGTLNLLLKHQMIWWVFWMLWGKKSINWIIKYVETVSPHVTANEEIPHKPLWRFSGEERRELSETSQIFRLELKKIYSEKEIKLSKIIKVRLKWKPSPSTIKLVSAITE